MDLFTFDLLYINVQTSCLNTQSYILSFFEKISSNGYAFFYNNDNMWHDKLTKN